MAEATKRAIGERFWGDMAQFDKNVRVAALVFVLAAIVSMSFTQLGFWSIGTIDSKQVYLLLVLGPLVMGAFLFGPITGALLGLFSGAVVFAHAVFFPLDFYEVYFMTPLNTFVLLTVLGALAGLAFSVLLKKADGGWRVALIVAICVVLSFAASGLVQLNTVIAYGEENVEIVREYLLNSPTGVVVQALVDAALMSILCCCVDRVANWILARADDRRLLAIFRGWMIVISCIVFMVTSGIIFSVATIQAMSQSEVSIRSEITYLQNQLADARADDYSVLLDGYEPDIDGRVVIADHDGLVLATDDDGWLSPGESVGFLLGIDPEETASELDAIIEDFEGVASVQEVDQDGSTTMDMALMAVGGYADGYVVMLQSSDLVFAGRFGIMAASTILALVLIVSISLVAARLLDQVVVRRIDETNDSLVKITDGNLSERVSVRDSREFASLSTGINTTVAALKDSIAEAEQKNAQELLTAKAIQESSLPREFPPFPEIDKFDIYASMKTAKEVGGDFYDFFLIGEEKLGFLMADVSGKGIPAALFMMTAKTQIQNYMEAGLPINEAVDAANHQLCIGNDAGMFVTMFACVLDYETGELSYVNAGHNPPLVLHEGTWGWMKDVSGMPLGLFDGIPYDAYTRLLYPGDVLYLYTDGVTEAMNEAGELFGEGRLEETLCRYRDMNPRSISVGVRRAITDFTLDCEQSDDITMLCLKYGVPPERKAVMILPALDTQLVHVNNFIHEELRRRGAPKSVRNPLDIAAEELFVNVCHYAYPEATPDDPGEVRIGFEYEANPPSLTVTISDDGIPYNPLEKPDAVTPDDIADVPIGGLGILMAKQSVDEMTYERVGKSNVLTFKKGW